jgi:hypothetical protein
MQCAEVAAAALLSGCGAVCVCDPHEGDAHQAGRATEAGLRGAGRRGLAHPQARSARGYASCPLSEIPDLVQAALVPRDIEHPRVGLWFYAVFLVPSNNCHCFKLLL